MCFHKSMHVIHVILFTVQAQGLICKKTTKDSISIVIFSKIIDIDHFDVDDKIFNQFINFDWILLFNLNLNQLLLQIEMIVLSSTNCM